MLEENTFPGKQGKPNAEVFNKILELSLAWTYLSAMGRGYLKQVEVQRISGVNTSTGSWVSVQGSEVFS